MKKKIVNLLIGVCCIGCLTGCASSAKNAPETEIGDEISVVSTSTAICEILDLLAYDNVVGVPETSATIPERYAGVDTVGEPMGPDMEIIKNISPTLVLSPVSLKDSLEDQYKSAGIQAEFLDLSSVQGMYESIDNLGALLGREEEAGVLREEYETYMEDYTKKTPEDNDCMILMCFPSGYYLIATEKSYVGNLVELAGGSNVYSDYQGDENGFVAINPEDMIQKNPDKIFVFAHYGEDEAFAQMAENFETEDTWQYYDAVKNGEIHYLSSEMFGMSATMAWMESLEYLRPVLYGE